VNLVRHDYAYPLRIDVGAGQVARVRYADHVNQLIEQLLLTSPGERVNMPEFGCGLRRAVFAAQNDALVATVKIQVQQAINAYLGDQVRLTAIDVRSGADPTSGVDEGELLVTLSYILVDTQGLQTVTVRVI
jgi:hypothetical protein